MKNQATIEFLIIFGLLLAGVGLAAFFSLQQITSIQSQQLAIESEKVLSIVASALDTTILEGDGFTTTVHLPELVSGRTYTILSFPNQIALRFDETDFLHSTLAGNMTGTFQKGENILTNQNGVVVIS